MPDRWASFSTASTVRTGIREESSTQGRGSTGLRGKRMVPDAIGRLAPLSATFLEPARHA